MRILISVDPEIPIPPQTYGGIERIVEALIIALQNRGPSVALIANPQSTCRADVFYGWSGLRSQRLIDSWRNMYALHAATSTFNPDVLHSFSRLLYMLPLMPSRLPKIMTFEREPTKRTV